MIYYRIFKAQFVYFYLGLSGHLYNSFIQRFDLVTDGLAFSQ